MAKKTKSTKKTKAKVKINADVKIEEENNNEFVAVVSHVYMPYKPRKINKLPKDLNDLKKKEWVNY